MFIPEWVVTLLVLWYILHEIVDRPAPPPDEPRRSLPGPEVISKAQRARFAVAAYWIRAGLEAIVVGGILFMVLYIGAQYLFR
jgi:hypothetical protein